jgi:SAM-dependent methyltransferase
MQARSLEPAESADAASGTLISLDGAAWALAAFLHLVRSGALTESGLSLSSPQDAAAARTLQAVGLVVDDMGVLRPATGLADLRSAGMLDTVQEATMSSLRQLATVVGILPAEGTEGWATSDDATLLAQGRSSALGGRMLAAFGVPGLDGLAARFSGGGDFLDVGVGVGELAAAFCEALPASRVVGIDVLPRALALARRTIDDRGLQDRIEVRLQAVQDLEDVERFDLAWLPAPFIPADIFDAALARVRQALRPGGWLALGAGRFDGEPLAVAVTRWKTLRAGGTPIAADEARAALESAHFVEFLVLPTPPGAPALYAARRAPASPPD